MDVDEMLKDLPKDCTVGCKRNAKGHTTKWIGYKLHMNTADGGVPIRCMVTSASMHDRQAAIPLSRITEQRVAYLYDLMDRAYDAEAQRAEPRDGFPSLTRIRAIKKRRMTGSSRHGGTHISFLRSGHVTKSDLP